jgi:hypothetical protein
MITLTIDAGAFDRLANAFMAAGDQAPHAIGRGLNRTGDKVRTQVKRALVQQTGLKPGVINRAVKTRRANYRDLSYVLKSRGGDISLKYLGAREVRGGVSAAPGGQRQIFPGAFIKSGRKPNRYAVKRRDGHVYRNLEGGRWGGKIEKVRSGIFIPKEMVSGASAQAFYSTAAQHLPGDVGKELYAILAGVAPRGRA